MLLLLFQAAPTGGTAVFAGLDAFTALGTVDGTGNGTGEEAPAFVNDFSDWPGTPRPLSDPIPLPTRRAGKASFVGLSARTALGQVNATGGARAKVAGLASASTPPPAIAAHGIQNLTDDELAFLLMSL